MPTTTRQTERRNSFAATAALALLGIGTVLPPGALAQGRTDTIALPGQAAPGVGGGTFSSLFTPVINASGQTAFGAEITGGSNTDGIFRSNNGAPLTAIGRRGQTAPGAGGGTFASLFSRVLNDSGQTAFYADITGGTNTAGIFRSDSANTLSAIARVDQSAPGEGGGTLFAFSSAVLNASGQTAFLASVAGGSNAQGVFRSSSGSTLTAIARAGQSAPGAGGGTFSSLAAPVLNDGGQTAFTSSITGGTSNRGIFLADGRETVAVQLQGASLAGKTVSALTSVTQDGLNNVGQVAYLASFTDGSNGVFVFTPALRWRESFSATWDSASHWTLGIAPGSVHDVSIDPTTSLNVTGPAGAVNLRSLVVGSGTGFATLTLGGGSIDSANPVQIASRGILAGGGSISAQVVNAGEVRADNLTLSGGLVNNGTVRGAATGHQRIDTHLSNNAAGLVRVGNSEMLKLVGSAHGNSGNVEVRGGGELQVGGAFTNAAAGRVVLDNGTVRFNDGLANNGQVQVSFGGATVFGAVTNNSGGKIILSGNSNTTFYDAIDVRSGGELRVSTGSTAVFFGLVQQRTGSLFTGTGAKFYEGGLAIGGSPGLGVDSGDVSFGAGNVFMVDIGGTTPCTAACDTDAAFRNSSFDKYIVTGHLGLGGALKLGSWNGFVPQLGQRFDLLDWGSAGGSFDSIDASGLLLPAGLVLDTSSLALDGSFSVVAVPEPQAWALWAAGLWAAGLWAVAVLRRRARRGGGHG
jgi:hypothetical protein